MCLPNGILAGFVVENTDTQAGSRPHRIPTQDLPERDGKNQVFGRVLSGLDLLHYISSLAHDASEAPRLPVTIKASGELPRGGGGGGGGAAAAAG